MLAEVAMEVATEVGVDVGAEVALALIINPKSCYLFTFVCFEPKLRIP